jgi:hypothetical protein
MRWEGNRESSNVEDYRAAAVAAAAASASAAAASASAPS